MLCEMKRNFEILKISFKYNILKEMENRGSFISQIIFMIISNVFFVVQWFVFFGFKESIVGSKFNDILIMWALVSASCGIAHLLFENVFYIPEIITTGKLDTYMIQPLDVLWHISISKTDSSALGDLLNGFILIFFAVGINLYKVLLFFLFFVLGGIFLAAFSALCGSLTFWFRCGEGILHNLYFSIVMAGTYPENIFNRFIKFLFYTVIPVEIMVYIPLKIISNWDFTYFVVVILFDVFLVFLTFYVFKKGLKTYSSNNLLNNRI